MFRMLQKKARSLLLKSSSQEPLFASVPFYLLVLVFLAFSYLYSYTLPSRVMHERRTHISYSSKGERPKGEEPLQGGCHLLGIQKRSMLQENSPPPFLLLLLFLNPPSLLHSLFVLFHLDLSHVLIDREMRDKRRTIHAILSCSYCATRHSRTLPFTIVVVVSSLTRKSSPRIEGLIRRRDVLTA